MTLPKQTITVLDPGLGLVDIASDTPLLLGHSSAGTAATLYSFSSLNDIRSTLGYGNLPEFVARCLRERGGPVLAMRSAGSVAAILSAVTRTGTGPTVTAAGTPTMAAKVRVEILVGGALGVATFRYTYERFSLSTVSVTWSNTRTVPAGGSFVLPNTGVTLTFPSGTYIAGDTYDLDTTPPQMNSSDLSTLMTAVLAIPSLDPKLIGITDSYPTHTTGYGMASALGGHLTTLATGYRYARGFCDVGSGDTSSNIVTNASGLTDKRISPWYGDAITDSVLPFEAYSQIRTSCVMNAFSRAAASLISTDLARYASGALSGVKHIYFDGYQDETVDNAGISTLRRWPGIPGFYIANGRLKAALGSDFQYVQYGRIMDAGCKAIYNAMLPFLAEGFRTITGGYIDPRDAADVETAGQRALSAALLEPSNARGTAGHVSSASFTVDQSNNLNSTGVLKTRVAVQPLGYAREIAQEIGFSLNP